MGGCRNIILLKYNWPGPQTSVHLQEVSDSGGSTVLLLIRSNHCNVGGSMTGEAVCKLYDPFGMKTWARGLAINLLSCLFLVVNCWIGCVSDMKSLESILRESVVQGQSRTHRPYRKILIIVEGVYRYVWTFHGYTEDIT